MRYFLLKAEVLVGFVVLQVLGLVEVLLGLHQVEEGKADCLEVHQPPVRLHPIPKFLRQQDLVP